MVTGFSEGLLEGDKCITVKVIQLIPGEQLPHQSFVSRESMVIIVLEKQGLLFHISHIRHDISLVFHNILRETFCKNYDNIRLLRQILRFVPKIIISIVPEMPCHILLGTIDRCSQPPDLAQVISQHVIRIERRKRISAHECEDKFQREYGGQKPAPGQMF